MGIIVNESDSNKKMEKKYRIPIFMRVGSPEYDEIYRKDILPIFNAFEYQRRDILHKFYMKSFRKYLLPFIIYVFLSLFSLSTSITSFICGLCMLGVIAALIIEFYLIARKKENINFANMMKEKVLQNLLKVFGNIKWLSHNANEENSGDELLTNEQLNESGLFIYYTTRYTDDEFEGVYKDVPFKISEMELLDRRGSGKNQVNMRVFKGIVLSFQSNKKINNRTVVATKGDFTKKIKLLLQ